MNTDPNTQPQEKPTLGQLWQDIKKHKKLYYKVLGITFIVSAIITLSIPNYYKCTVMLAPELSGGNKSTSGLASLASSFGVNLGSANSGMDAILPTFYPDLMNSVTFRASLFPVKVQREGEDLVTTYYDYLLYGQKAPWWSQATKAIFSIFANPEVADSTLNTFKLTKEQSAVVETIGKKVVCDVDNKTMVITIDVEDQDPLICATMADSVRVRLQDFITDYRTSKARVDLDYTRKLYAEAKAKYDQARSKYATYADANQRVFLERVRSELSELQTELQLAQTAYTQIAARLQLAEAKVQEETPAFTILQPATVPIKKAGPQRSKICLIFLFLAFIATTLYVWNKESHLKALLRSDKSTPDFDELTLEDLSFLLSQTRPSKPEEKKQ